MLLLFLGGQSLCLSLVGFRSLAGLLLRKGKPSGISRGPQFTVRVMYAQALILMASCFIWVAWDWIEARFIPGPGWDLESGSVVGWWTVAAFAVQIASLSVWYFLYRWGLACAAEAPLAADRREEWAAWILLSAILVVPIPGAILLRFLFWSHPGGVLGYVSLATIGVIILLSAVGLLSWPFKKANQTFGWIGRWASFSLLCGFVLSTMGMMLVERYDVERARAYCNRVWLAIQAYERVHGIKPGKLGDLRELPSHKPRLVREAAMWNKNGDSDEFRFWFCGTMSPVESYYLDKEHGVWKRKVLNKWY